MVELTKNQDIAFPEIEISEDLVRRFDVSGPRYTSYPTADRFDYSFKQERFLPYLQERANPHAGQEHPPLSLYFHLPFCRSLCYFCGCNKIITQDYSRSAQYIEYVCKEMDLLVPHLGADRRAVQLHLGGGTPTFMSQLELAQLMDHTRSHFEFTPDAELGVEIDPRTVNEDSLSFLAAQGFNRCSFGVQDFDPEVQAAVNRIQPVDMVERAVKASRDTGYESVNADLIYGLPKQTLESFERTIDEVIRISPDRIALYNYAHLPSRFKAQRMVKAEDLPSAETRLQIFLLSTRRLLEAGYLYIGLDHFAKPNDELSLARQNKSLHRNFQGYTTRAECDLVGFGVSAIGKVGRSYSGNVRTVNAYYEALDQGRLPVERGYDLSTDDVLRREVIMILMCSMPLRFDEIEARYGIEFESYFGPELEQLCPYEEVGLMETRDRVITVTPKGRLFVRALGMVFDKYLSQPTVSTYSRLI